MSATELETYFDAASGTTITDLRIVQHAEPRSPWVPPGYHLRFGPSMLSQFEATDTGYTVDGRPCWRTRFSHGRTQPANREAGYYADEVYNKSLLLGRPLQVIDGSRALVAHKSPDGVKYISGADASWVRYYYQASVITTQMLYNFEPPAYVEVRVKLPDVAGVWPAVWMLPASGVWPPEIDMLEHMGQGSADPNANPSVIWTNHHYTNQYGRTSVGGGWKSIAPDVVTDWTTLGLLWLPDSLVFFVNGRVVSQSDCHWPAGLAAYLLLNVAVGGTWPGTPPASAQFPAAMLVDYVRVYQP